MSDPTKRATELAHRQQSEGEGAAHREQSRSVRRQEWEANLARRFPRLAQSLPLDVRLYGRERDLPIDLMSRTQWRRLGYRVTATKARSFLVLGKGSLVRPLFLPTGVEEIPSRRRNLTAEQLWEGYLARGLSAAHAVWAVNRLAKLFPDHKSWFYHIKDDFIMSHQGYLAEGRFVRKETDPCWECDEDDDDYECWKCDGTGVYRRRTLYEHVFDFDDRRYCFHSYIEPRSVGPEAGANLPAYGRRLTARDTIPYRIGEYRTMLHYLSRSWP